MMFRGGITKDGLSTSKVGLHVVISWRVKANYVLCVQHGKWIHSKCIGVKMVTSKFSRNFLCRKCEGNIGEAMEQEEYLCDEVKTVRAYR